MLGQPSARRADVPAVQPAAGHHVHRPDQLVRALRGDPISADIPLVMLTALAQDEHQLGGLLAGADRADFPLNGHC